MRRLPPALGTVFDGKLETWTVVIVGAGKRWLPAEGTTWTLWEAVHVIQASQRYLDGYVKAHGIREVWS